MSKQKSTEYKNSSEYKDSVVKGQEEWRTSVHGPKQTHTKVCENIKCGKLFEWIGREHTIRYKAARFCSVACAHSRSEYWDENATRYQTIAFKHHNRKCVICDETKILDVHHLDENRDNNDPSNLIPLCPTHHRYWHSRYKNLIESAVMEYITQWKDNQSVLSKADGRAWNAEAGISKFPTLTIE